VKQYTLQNINRGLLLQQDRVLFIMHPERWKLLLPAKDLCTCQAPVMYLMQEKE
jgi:hypothetical protein